MIIKNIFVMLLGCYIHITQIKAPSAHLKLQVATTLARKKLPIIRFHLIEMKSNFSYLESGSST